jgi:hypothetical protein
MYEMTQWTRMRTKVPARDEKNGAVPEKARLAIDPMTMTRMASKPVASLRKALLREAEIPDKDKIDDDCS